MPDITTHTQKDDKALVEGCLNGDKLCQKKLFEKYYAKMLGVCMRYTTNRDEAKDILQEGYIKTFNSLINFSFNCPLEAWIRRIMINTSIDFYRRGNLLDDKSDLENVAHIGTPEEATNLMNHAELLNLLNRLPSGYKMVFNLYNIEGYSHKEISEMLGIGEGTSKSQLAKARIYLQKLISTEYSEA